MVPLIPCQPGRPGVQPAHRCPFIRCICPCSSRCQLASGEWAGGVCHLRLLATGTGFQACWLLSLRGPGGLGNIIERLASGKHFTLQKYQDTLEVQHECWHLHQELFQKKGMQTNFYMVAMRVSHLSTDSLLPWLRGNRQCIWQRGRQRHDKLSRPARREQVVFLQRGSGEASQNGWLSSDLKFEPCLIWCFAEEPETSKLESTPRLPWPFTGRGILESISGRWMCLLCPKFPGRIYPPPLLSNFPKLPKDSIKLTCLSVS